MLSLYVFIEFLLLILIIVGSISFDNLFFFNIIKFLPTLITLLFSLSNKNDKRLRFSFLMATIAAFCFLLLDDCTLGISLFVIVQIFNLLYLTNSKKKVLLILSIINLISVFIFNSKILLIEVLIYTLLISFNIFKSFKLEKKDINFSLVKKSLIFLLICDICIAVKFLFSLSTNIELIVNLTEWIFYVASQILMAIYAAEEYDSVLYKVLRPIFSFIFKIYYNPTIVNKEYIPKEGAAVIAGNHKHALDPIFVDYCTKRVVHTLAKKDLHDGIFGSFFKAIGTIPVDLKAKHNKESLLKAIDYLNEGVLINVSPEAKRNYTNEILLPFKVGAVVMAQRTNCKIVPYSITGDYKFRSKNLKITFGKPLDVSKLTVEEANNLLYKKVKKLLLEARK